MEHAKDISLERARGPGSWRGFTKALRLADKGVSKITSLGAWVSSALIFTMMILIGIEVVMRSGFSKSTLIADEYTGYLMVAVVFLGFAYTSKVGGHIGVDLLISKLSEKTRLILEVVYYVVALAYIGILVRQFLVVVLDSLSGGATSITVARTPLFIPQLFMPIGLLLFELELFAEFVKACRQLFIYRQGERGN